MAINKYYLSYINLLFSFTLLSPFVFFVVKNVIVSYNSDWMNLHWLLCKKYDMLYSILRRKYRFLRDKISNLIQTFIKDLVFWYRRTFYRSDGFENLLFNLLSYVQVPKNSCVYNSCHEIYILEKQCVRGSLMRVVYR